MEEVNNQEAVQAEAQAEQEVVEDVLMQEEGLVEPTEAAPEAPEEQAAPDDDIFPPAGVPSIEDSGEFGEVVENTGEDTDGMG
jgi:hypothetical protein